ncbi:hypothetical protein D3C80_2034890 [compost metagenome]
MQGILDILRPTQGAEEIHQVEATSSVSTTPKLNNRQITNTTPNAIMIPQIQTPALEKIWNTM